MIKSWRDLVFLIALLVFLGLAGVQFKSCFIAEQEQRTIRAQACIKAGGKVGTDGLFAPSCNLN
jgi:hypothetical protein